MNPAASRRASRPPRRPTARRKLSTGSSAPRATATLAASSSAKASTRSAYAEIACESPRRGSTIETASGDVPATLVIPGACRRRPAEQLLREPLAHQPLQIIVQIFVALDQSDAPRALGVLRKVRQYDDVPPRGTRHRSISSARLPNVVHGESLIMREASVNSRSRAIEPVVVGPRVHDTPRFGLFLPRASRALAVLPIAFAARAMPGLPPSVRP